MKTDKQWCKDNNVPETARWSNSYNVGDVIKMINAMLKTHNLQIRTKRRSTHGPGSHYIWVEHK
jgi:hypothetical protein